MQFQAVPVVSSKNHETKTKGAAYLAGLDVGYFKSTGEISSQWKPGETFIPRMRQDRRESLRSGWSKVLHGTKPDMHANLPDESANQIVAGIRRNPLHPHCIPCGNKAQDHRGDPRGQPGS